MIIPHVRCLPLGLERTYGLGDVKKRDMVMNPLVSVVMGSKSDWETMSHAVETLEKLGVPCEARILSAHRTPDHLFAYLAEAEAKGIEVFMGAAGGAAHLAGVMASKTLLPVLGVPMDSKALHGLDSLLSMVQMPAGIPVATFAIGQAGAVNAALFAAAILGLSDTAAEAALDDWRLKQTQGVAERPDRR